MLSAVLLLILILFLIVNCGLAAIVVSVVIDTPPDVKRRGMFVIASVLTANTVVFLTLYALYSNGFFN